MRCVISLEDGWQEEIFTKIIIKKIVNIDDDKENFNEKIKNLQNDELDDNTDLDGVDQAR